MLSDDGFVSMMKFATGCPTFVPPCYSSVTESVHSVYIAKKSILRGRLVAAPAVSITADFWTSLANNNYLGVTAHFIENWELKSTVLDVLYCTILLWQMV